MYTTLMASYTTVVTDLFHKSHNAPVPYPTMHHFVTEMYTFLLQNGALLDIFLMHCGICEIGLASGVLAILYYAIDMIAHCFV